MHPDDIRRLYQEESEATEEEARATQDEVRSDPEAARTLVDVLAALATQEHDSAVLLQLVLNNALLGFVRERMAQDDAYALHIGKLIVAMQEKLKPASKVKRGKNAKTA